MAFKFQGVNTPRTREAVTPASKHGAVELSLYREQPCGEISLEEFEKFALDRLRSEMLAERGCCGHDVAVGAADWTWGWHGARRRLACMMSPMQHAMQHAHTSTRPAATQPCSSPASQRLCCLIATATPSLPFALPVLKAIEEAKLRSKGEAILQARGAGCMLGAWCRIGGRLVQLWLAWCVLPACSECLCMR